MRSFYLTLRLNYTQQWETYYRRTTGVGFPSNLLMQRLIIQIGNHKWERLKVALNLLNELRNVFVSGGVEINDQYAYSKMRLRLMETGLFASNHICCFKPAAVHNSSNDKESVHLLICIIQRMEIRTNSHYFHQNFHECGNPATDTVLNLHQND